MTIRLEDFISGLPEREQVAIEALSVEMIKEELILREAPERSSGHTSEKREREGGVCRDGREEN